MTTFIGRFTPGQISALTTRAAVIVKVPSSTTGTLVPGDDFGEFYLDDPNATFVTAGVANGDILRITAGPITPLGEYSVSAFYFDPKDPAVDTDGAEHQPYETRLIINGFPTLGGAVTYEILSNTALLDELAQLTTNVSRIENVTKPALLELDGIFTEFQDQFDRVCDFVADTYRQLTGGDRDRVDAALITASAQLVTPTVLFPLGYADLKPLRTTIDNYTADLTNSGSEQEGLNNEIAAEPASSGGPLLTAYTDALAIQDAALIAQDVALVALQGEIADNDTTTEAGDLNVLYTALSAVVTAQISSVADRRQDIADIISADDTRPNVGGLFFGSFGALQAEINLRKGELLSAAFHTVFLDKRFTYLNSLVNRAFGTRTDLEALDTQVNFSIDRAATLVDESATDRQLLQLP